MLHRTLVGLWPLKAYDAHNVSTVTLPSLTINSSPKWFRFLWYLSFALQQNFLYFSHEISFLSLFHVFISFFLLSCSFSPCSLHLVQLVGKTSSSSILACPSDSFEFMERKELIVTYSIAAPDVWHFLERTKTSLVRATVKFEPFLINKAMSCTNLVRRTIFEIFKDELLHKSGLGQVCQILGGSMDVKSYTEKGEGVQEIFLRLLK